MVITKSSPFTSAEIEALKEQFEVYIKTVIDVKKQLCSAGCDRHFESEKILLDQGSIQSDLWGGGVDLETKTIDFNSMINIRPSQNNPSNELLDPKLRQKFKTLMSHFFKKVL